MTVYLWFFFVWLGAILSEVQQEGASGAENVLSLDISENYQSCFVTSF